MAQEMVEFPNGTLGLAFNLDEHNIGVMILGEYLKISEGEEVKSTGRVLTVPVGEAFLGRVVDPLGNPVDGRGSDCHQSPPRRGIQTLPAWLAASRCVGRGNADRHQGHRRA